MIGLIGHVCSYVRLKQILSILSHLSDFVTCDFVHVSTLRVRDEYLSFGTLHEDKILHICSSDTQTNKL